MEPATRADSVAGCVGTVELGRESAEALATFRGSGPSEDQQAASRRVEVAEYEVRETEGEHGMGRQRSGPPRPALAEASGGRAVRVEAVARPLAEVEAAWTDRIRPGQRVVLMP